MMLIVTEQGEAGYQDVGTCRFVVAAAAYWAEAAGAELVPGTTVQGWGRGA